MVGPACQDGTVADPLEAPLRLVLGDEELLVSRAVAEVAGAARAADSEADIRDLAGAELAAGDLYDLLSPSLFGGRRVVVVRGAHEAKPDVAEALRGYVADPAAEVVLVLVHPGGARGKALVDAMRGAGAVVVECVKLTRAEERLAFVRAEVARVGGSITPEAAAVLLDAVGNDLRELSTACSQLVADTGGRIDGAAVTRYHRGRAEVLVADALADGVRSIARVSAAGRGNPYAMAGQLGMPPWKVKRAQSQARGWSEAGLSRAMRVVAELNAGVKGVAADPSYALEAAIQEVAAARTNHS
jgi:DNA polymerase-3 subunit delta